MTKILLHSTVVWLGLFALAFVNGALREVLMKNVIGIEEPLAHQLSCLTGAVLWTGLTWLAWKWVLVTSFKEAAIVGVFWFVLTILTETFLINRLMSKLTWEQIFQTYNIAQGEYWGLVLIWVGLLPIVVRALKGPSQ